MNQNKFVFKANVSHTLGSAASIDHEAVHLVGNHDPYKTIDVYLWEKMPADITTMAGLFFVTPRLSAAIENASLTGLKQREFTMNFEPQMQLLNMFEGYQMPILICYEIVGEYGKDDFSEIENVYGTIVTDRAIKVFEQFDLNGCTFTPQVDVDKH